MNDPLHVWLHLLISWLFLSLIFGFIRVFFLLDFYVIE